MLGTDGRLYDSDFDFDGDGKLNAYEYSVMDDVVFGHEDTETSEVDELEDELSLAGLDATELEYMDADERINESINTEVNVSEEKARQKLRYDPDICPECGGRLRLIQGPFGKFMGCENYPTCKFNRRVRKK